MILLVVKEVVLVILPFILQKFRDLVTYRLLYLFLIIKGPERHKKDLQLLVLSCLLEELLDLVDHVQELADDN